MRVAFHGRFSWLFVYYYVVFVYLAAAKVRQRFDDLELPLLEGFGRSVNEMRTLVTGGSKYAHGRAGPETESRSPQSGRRRGLSRAFEAAVIVEMPGGLPASYAPHRSAPDGAAAVKSCTFISETEPAECLLDGGLRM